MKNKFVHYISQYVYLKSPSVKRYLLFAIFALSSCNYYQEFSQPKITILSPPRHKQIKTIAILPFKNLTQNKEIPIILREAIFRNLSLKDYDLINLKQIDQILQMASYHKTDLYSLGNFKLGKIVNADALIYGTITKCSKLFYVVYSRVTIGAEMAMVDTSNSKILWKANHVELTHSGTPPLSPFNIPEKIIDSRINVRDKVIKDTADKLAKKLVKDIPESNFGETLRKYAISIKNVGNRKEVHYKVQTNDTLYKIARKFYGQGSKWMNIKYANNEIKNDSLKVGHDLILPDVPVLTNINDAKLLDNNRYKKAVYKAKWGDSLYYFASIIYHNGEKWRIIYEQNKEEIEDMKDLPVGQVIIIPLIHEDQIISKSKI